MGIILLDGFNHIYVDSSFNKELQKCLMGYSNIDHFTKWYMASLQILDDPDIGLEYPRFEHIENNIYSMRYKGKKNIRILFCKSKGLIKILSCAFEEKSKSDYELSKRIVRQRKKQY